MEEVRKLLLTGFWCQVALAAIVAVLYETDLMESGTLAEQHTAEFLLATTMELLTLATIPLALKLFRLQRIKSSLKETRERALKRWGLVRMEMLLVPLLLNTILYYLFLNVAFGYMAIILVLCLPFVYPSRERCKMETEGL